MVMDIAMLGLGRMGGNMARRLLRGGHRVVLWNRSPEPAEQIKADEKRGDLARQVGDLAKQLASPRHAWMMLPAGKPTEEMLENLLGVLQPGDTLIDGGNTNYKDTQRRAVLAEGRGLNYVDVGVSGGIWGLTVGYGMMVGGKTEVVEKMRPIFETLAPARDQGWAHLGPHGAGHYAKMVHNGIEYGMMQAFAEGFEILHAKKDMHYDLYQVAEAWRYGTVIRSWLLDLCAEALKDDGELSSIEGFVQDSGEGRWTIQEAIDLDVPAPVITQSLFHRFYSRKNGDYASRLLAAMRNQFGGHTVKKA
jgi:6-phosphogluconate dehydrogenase